MSNYYRCGGGAPLAMGYNGGEAAPSAQSLVEWAAAQTPRQWADAFTGGAVTNVEERVVAAEQTVQQARTMMAVSLGIGIVSLGLLAYVALR